MKKRELEDWERAECAALKSAIDAYNAGRSRADSLTQGKIADALGINQGSVSSYLNGYNALNAKVASVIAGMIDRPVSSFSQRLAKEIQALAGGRPIATLTGSAGTAEAQVLAMIQKHAGKALDEAAQGKLVGAVIEAASEPTNVISADFSGLRTRSTEILIPQYDIRGAMGHGQVPADYNEAIRNMIVEEDVLREKGVTYTSAAALAMITGWGQSMEGTINDKDPVIVDRGVNDFIGEGVYVITWHDLLYIKRIQMMDGEHFRLISDNQHYENQTARTDDVTIHAKVLLVWNAKKV